MIFGLQTPTPTTWDERLNGVAVFNFQVNGFHTDFLAAKRHHVFLFIHNTAEGCELAGIAGTPFHGFAENCQRQDPEINAHTAARHSHGSMR